MDLSGHYREALETIAVFNTRDSEGTGFPSVEAQIAREALEKARTEHPRGAVSDDEVSALLEAINNLRGWRVQGQTHYLAHVDAIDRRVRAITDHPRGAVSTDDDQRLIETLARVIENRHGTLHGIGSTLREALAEYRAATDRGAVSGDALREARLYGEKMLRDADESIRRCGADLLQILDG